MVINPSSLEANQLAIYLDNWGVELTTTEKKILVAVREELELWVGQIAGPAL